MSGCGCSSCGCDALASRDPYVVMMRARASRDSASMGGLLPTFVTPAAVRAQKERLHPAFVATDAAVQACSSLPPIEKAAWVGFFESWKAYHAADDSFWGVKSEFDSGLAFELALSRWQEQLASKCSLPSPRIVVPSDTGPDLSALKWVAAAVIAVSVVYGVHTVVR